MGQSMRIFLVILILCYKSLAWAGEGERECEQLVATGNPEYPPYLWRDSGDNRALLGANKILMDEISRRLAIPIKLIYTGPWSRAQVEVRAGRVDLMAGAFLTAPRLQYMDYIQPAFLMTRSVVWKRRFVDFQYQEWADLIPYQGATVINNSFGQEFDHFAREHLDIEAVASLEQAFRMLAQGRVDYLLYEDYPGKAYAERMDLSFVVEQVGPPISEEGLFLTISHKSHCNTDAMQEQLATIMSDIVSTGFAEQALEVALETWNKQK